MTLNFPKRLVINGTEWNKHPLTFDVCTINGGKVSPSWQDIILSGNTALTLTNALANGLNYLKLFGGTEQRNLPSGFTQVEYLESSGTQYIDTGVKPNSNTAISIKYYPAVSSVFMCLYGTQDGSSLNRFYGLISVTQFRLQINSNAGQPPNYWGINKNGTLVANDNGSFAQTQGIVTLGVDNKNKVISVKSDEYTGNISASDTVLGDNLNCQYNMLLLSRGTAGTPANNFSGRLYSFTIKENDVLIQNLIPCRRNSDSVLGMYDTVTGNFLTNAGTGTFTAGSDVTPSPDTPMDINCNNGAIKVSKNLFNKASVTTGEILNDTGTIVSQTIGFYSVPIVVQPNMAYTYQQIGGMGIYVRILEYNVNDTLVKLNKGTTGGTQTLNFTTSSTTTYVIISGSVAQNALDTIQLEQGSTPTTYMPYGQIYTDGTTETVEITGKNLFDKSIFAGDSSDTIIYTSYSVPNGTYTMSSPDYPWTSSVTNVFFLTGNVSTGASSSLNGVALNKPITITVTDGYYTIGHRYVSGSNLNNANPIDYKWQIEQGSTATTYEPYYNGGIATAEMLLKVDTYQDVQSVIDGGVTKNVGIKVLDGSEEWRAHSSLAGWFQLSVPLVYGGLAPALCTHYPYSPTQGAVGVYFSTGRNAPQTNRIIIADNVNFPNTSMLAEFKQYLATQYANGTPVIVVYPLDTATTETVTAQPMNIQEGTNVVEITQASMDNLGLEVSYKATV